jgi:hypothetical protein
MGPAFEVNHLAEKPPPLYPLSILRSKRLKRSRDPVCEATEGRPSKEENDKDAIHLAVSQSIEG